MPPRSRQFGLLCGSQFHGCAPSKYWADSAELLKIPIELFERGFHSERARQVSNANHELLPVRLPCTFASGMHRMCQCRILLSLSLFVKVFGRVVQVRSRPFLSLAHDGAHRGEDTTVVIHRIVKNRACSHASVLRVGGWYHAVAIDPVSG